MAAHCDGRRMLLQVNLLLACFILGSSIIILETENWAKGEHFVLCSLESKPVGEILWDALTFCSTTFALILGALFSILVLIDCL